MEVGRKVGSKVQPAGFFFLHFKQWNVVMDTNMEPETKIQKQNLKTLELVKKITCLGFPLGCSGISEYWDL